MSIGRQNDRSQNSGLNLEKQLDSELFLILHKVVKSIIHAYFSSLGEKLLVCVIEPYLEVPKL